MKNENGRRSKYRDGWTGLSLGSSIRQYGDGINEDEKKMTVRARLEKRERKRIHVVSALSHHFIHSVVPFVPGQSLR